MQRIGPLDAAQVPPVGLLISMAMLPAGTGVTRPKPLNVMLDWPAETTAFFDPSLPARVWMIRGATGTAKSAVGADPQLLVAASRLTTQFFPAVDSVQVLSS